MEVGVTLEIVFDELIRLRESVDELARNNLKMETQLKAVRKDTTNIALSLTWEEARPMMSTRDVANSLGVTYREVIRIIDAGYLKAERLRPGGEYRIDRFEFERYKRDRGIRTRRVA